MNSQKVMVALDNFQDLKTLESFVANLPAELPVVKIGLEMFYRFGPELVKRVHTEYRKKIFLDLKLHDIPNTTAKAMTALMELPIDFLTVHLAGGREMLEACQKVREERKPQLNVLGVSYLTSLDHQNFKEHYSIEKELIPSYFENLFKLASTTNTQGVVCSAAELSLLKNYPKLIKVCPGIRFSDEIEQGNVGDQKRVLSPEKAFEAGASYLVMGRSLTGAKNLHSRIQELNQ